MKEEEGQVGSSGIYRVSGEMSTVAKFLISSRIENGKLIAMYAHVWMDPLHLTITFPMYHIFEDMVCGYSF